MTLLVIALYLLFGCVAVSMLTIPSVVSIWRDAWLAGYRGREFNLLELTLSEDDYLLPSAYARYLAGVEARGRLWGEAGLTDSITRARYGRLSLLTGAHSVVS